jgi:uncharacterized damage-inducible protein DinB
MFGLKVCERLKAGRKMNADSTASRERGDRCCNRSRTLDEEQKYRSVLEFHRAAREQTVKMVQELSQNQMDYRPEPGKWSVGEVLDHLILGQRLNLSYLAQVIGMKEAGQRPVLRLSFTDVDVSIAYLPKAVLPALEVPFRVMNMFLPSSVRDFLTRYRLVPAQNAELTTPRRGRATDELRNDLVCSLKEMEVLLESHQHLDYSDMVVEHPLLGNNTVPGLLRFLTLHEQRHRSQIESVLNSPGFPRST